jgi:hypothetical protein
MNESPLNINFEYSESKPSRPGIVRLPKIRQGAPYDVTFRINTGTAASPVYRDFTPYDAMRMQVRLAQDGPVLFELSKAGGELIGTSTSLRLAFLGSKTAWLELPVSANEFVNEVPFVYDLELIIGAEVAEQFAAGTGFIVVNTTR